MQKVVRMAGAGRGEADLEIDALLGDLGFRDPEAARRARTELERQGLTNKSKGRISRSKVGRVRQILADAFVLCCSDRVCQEVAAKARPEADLIEALARDCSQCGGSPNVRATNRFVALCDTSHVRRLVVVGGSPSIRQEMSQLIGRRLDLRLIDGTGRRTKDQASADLEWGDLVLIAGTSELKHRMSNHYTEPAEPHSGKVLQVNRRGIAALLDYASEHMSMRSSRTRSGAGSTRRRV